MQLLSDVGKKVAKKRPLIPKSNDLHRPTSLFAETVGNPVMLLSYYGIPHERFLEYIGNLDSMEELKTEIADLQNQDTILTTKVIDLHQKFRNLDSDCKAKKDKVDRLTLEEKRLAIKIVELQKQ